MRNKTLFLIILIIFGIVLVFWNNFLGFYSKLFTKLPQIEKGLTELVIEETGKRVSIPSPLRFEKEAPETFLTRTGVIKWTNIQREKYGLLPYFAYNSPSGVGVDDLAGNFGYKFIAIGENLALGNFENDEVLLQGWMNSPGHRENILNTLK